MENSSLVKFFVANPKALEVGGDFVAAVKIRSGRQPGICVGFLTEIFLSEFNRSHIQLSFSIGGTYSTWLVRDLIEIHPASVPDVEKEIERLGCQMMALSKSVDELELSVRSYNNLKNMNIKTIGQLVEKSELQLSKTTNFGRKSINEIKEILGSMNLALRP